MVSGGDSSSRVSNNIDYFLWIIVYGENWSELNRINRVKITNSKSNFYRPEVMFKRFSYLRNELIVSHACKLFNDESFKGLSGFHCRFNNLESEILKTCRGQRWTQHFYFWGQKSFSVWFLDIYPSSWQRFKNLITTLRPRLTKLVIWWLYNEQNTAAYFHGYFMHTIFLDAF